MNKIRTFRYLFKQFLTRFTKDYCKDNEPLYHSFMYSLKFNGVYLVLFTFTIINFKERTSNTATVSYNMDSSPFGNSAIGIRTFYKGEMVWRNEVVDDVVGYHCQAWKCVVSNIGLQKKKKNYLAWLLGFGGNHSLFIVLCRHHIETRQIQ